MTDQPTALEADLRDLILTADPAAVPVTDSTGPADDMDVDQEPGYEEVDVPDDQADTSLTDPAVQEL